MRARKIEQPALGYVGAALVGLVLALVVVSSAAAPNWVPVAEVEAFIREKERWILQRLAERAATATKQIEVLVRTIQADTNEAVVSMERTTTDVVGGALLAENAGAALEEIEQVSNQIASLVQNISASSRQQAGVSQSISRNMQVLREISSQTADATSSTVPAAASASPIAMPVSSTAAA